MIKNIYSVFIISTLFIFLSCSQKTQLSKETIQVKFGYEYTLEWNTDSTFVLGIKKNGKISSEFLSPLEYFIFDVNKEKQTFKETVSGGSVHWKNASRIVINLIPGNISEDEELNNLTYHFDVVKNEKIRNGE